MVWLVLVGCFAWMACGAIGHLAMCREMKIEGAEFVASALLIIPIGPFALLLALMVRATRPS